MIFVISALIALLFILVAIQLGLTKKKQKQQFQSTLTLVAIIKRIIGLTQKHRGLTATYLQGNQSASTDIYALRNEISGLIKQTNELEQVNIESRWEAYLDHWQRLESSSMGLTAPESFKQHTSLIGTLLYLLQDVAEHIEFSDMEQQLKDTHFLWREFPQLVEYIGQARAVGVATATKGESTQIDKVKLGYLCEKINLMSDTVFNKLSAVAQVSENSQLNQAKQACLQLVSLINEQLIKPNKVSIGNQEYFATASSTMDQCNTLLDNELNAIVNKLG
ncbi:nitrate- and nitrite sensing domain-containing protein [Alteromonas lipolytica]|uniref:Nitrate/nitrite sensing protein domain-containing protein n=1 Tax=Alteromonas lipolytica TaxID=1856405 RepID=A0A1E8FHZ4_9ALTE|nr:nitrate- and nitrite sensing domain-containing protein [Alteromonas lipolytica]OFI35238.1 hypothetical protein BFC17_17000 [Alteromonas lipolytica]GGF57851.1 hypothetical protein GCM10011338_07660 [Alteromonas lipolytica]